MENNQLIDKLNSLSEETLEDDIISFYENAERVVNKEYSPTNVILPDLKDYTSDVWRGDEVMKIQENYKGLNDDLLDSYFEASAYSITAAETDEDMRSYGQARLRDIVINLPKNHSNDYLKAVMKCSVGGVDEGAIIPKLHNLVRRPDQIVDKVLER